MTATLLRYTVSATVAVLFYALLAAGPAVAAGAGSSPQPGTPANPDYTTAVALIGKGDFAGALPLLRKAEAKAPDNADVHNWLGYALRNLKRYDAALKHYGIALRIEPRHRGANEYLGELYLALGQLEKAEERLAVLDRACLFGCEEYTELKEAIEAYKAKHGKGD
ncbi:MAG: tetratricopeptide repeat protein [Rhodospirillaceae bacterium]|nr:tetratricopeptide repeat protein [Rhodospirillaceae bacterium]MDE0619690.1 tetratricopeptide repeat protein [Rhodospirillaceae bacterium]